jgi:hypothetical protein
MECFIDEEGIERKAELEDILPLIDNTRIMPIYSGAYKLNISLPYVLAYMPDEIKNLFYRNLLLRIRGRLEKEVKDVESRCEKNDRQIQNARAELFSYIGKNKNWIWIYGLPECIVWKEKEPKKESPKKEPLAPAPIDELVNKIEEACNSGNLCLYFNRDEISKDELQKTFSAFHGRKNELQKIRTLDISPEDLYAVAVLFEAGGIEKLRIHGEFTGTWPEFLENCQSLTSIELIAWEGSIEFPLWLRNAVSLRYLTIESLILLPDWIGDIQSITQLTIYDNTNKTLPDSIGDLKNLTRLEISLSAIEKLPDSIGNLSSLNVLILSENKNLTSLPDSICNLGNLTKLLFDGKNKLERLPDSIGSLGNLIELYLVNCESLKCLPDSIGKLKNLTTLDLFGSPIEKLPDTIANCTSLEFVDMRATNINSFPDFLFSIKTFEQSMEMIPKKHSIS